MVVPNMRWCFSIPVFHDDQHATTINETMKIAAVQALAQLAREDVPDSVIRAHGKKPIQAPTQNRCLRNRHGHL